MSLRHYGRWLRDNYSSNGGALFREYLSQVLTVAIIAFLVWRVETLQELTESEEENQQ